jgi:hypothetical protein
VLRRSASQHRHMNTTDFIVPIMLGVLFALLLALALWLFVDLPLFLPDEG